MKIKFCSRDGSGDIDWFETGMIYLLVACAVGLVFCFVMYVRAANARQEFIDNVPPGFHVEYVPHQRMLMQSTGKGVIVTPYTDWEPVYVKDKD